MKKKDFKKKFPKLCEEIEENTQIIQIDGIRWDETNRNELSNPDVFSFLRRCQSDEEGFEIIEYLEKRGEISKEMAEDLTQQIKSRGIRSFGSKKEWGYYEKKYRR